MYRSLHGVPGVRNQVVLGVLTGIHAVLHLKSPYEMEFDILVQLKKYRQHFNIFQQGDEKRRIMRWILYRNITRDIKILRTIRMLANLLMV